mmetsp:Transcript_122394/g.347041  ORF Transcript_122394/g.347041 Transcript_122394/m.347041 type:complete len:226 (-) Transcript_122394:160-837(-)
MPAPKLFTAAGTPNPDVVHMYLEEAGLAGPRVEVVEVGIGGKSDGRSAEGLRRNPLGELPSLERADGTFMSESVSICEYLDAEYGPTPLVGMTASERGDTSMWTRRVEQKVTDKMGDAFRSGPMKQFFDTRRPGTTVPEGVEGSKRNARLGLEFLESQLADGRDYLCGSRFSLADIALYVRFKFFSRRDKGQADVAKGLPFFQKWLDRVSARPSATAIVPKKSKL